MKSLRDIESARYVLLRRLAPAIRHGIVGTLHPIGLMSDVLARRIQSASDMAQAREGLERINGLSRTALSSCTGLMSWFAPEDGDRVSLQQGVEQCLSLLGTEMGMRGHVLDGQADFGADRVAGSAVRQVLAAVLLALMDAEPHPMDLQLRVKRAGPIGNAATGSIGLALAWTRASRPQLPAPDDLYRPMTWEDVELLAGAEGVEVLRGDQSLDLRFDIVSG